MKSLKKARLSAHYTLKKFVGADYHEYVAHCKTNNTDNIEPKAREPWTYNGKYRSKNNKGHANSHVIKNQAKQSSPEFFSRSQNKKSSDNPYNYREKQRKISGKYRGVGKTII
jgi:uncharacterized short protein YbdD (DUF466 family)